MLDLIWNLEDKVMKGGSINYEEAVELSKIENFHELYQAADRIRKKLCGDVVDLCSIMNAKSGKCTEDCKYCAQSAHYHTNIPEYDLVNEAEALKLAQENEDCGINRFSLVTSGRGLSGEEFDKTVKIYKRIKGNVKIDLCASFGIIDLEQLLELKEVGISMYHHNLETSRPYYGKICTTHTYDDRINTIKNAKKAGLKVCSGGIIGMGETMEDRINMALELRALEIASIPVNVLNPIPGTPLEGMVSLEQEEILKTIAIFRFINPKAQIRLAGGRNLIDEFGKFCFTAGANATISGNYLTTAGNKIVDDIKMIEALELMIKKNE